MSDDFVGVRILESPAPFQVVQQDASGLGMMAFSGQWRHNTLKGNVQLRMVKECDGTIVSRSTDWQSAEDQEDENWSHTMRQIPTGGLYRLETRLATEDAAAEWSTHGNTVHHLSVGDLWVIAGQSNAAGYGRGPVFDPPELGVHVLKNDESWDVAAHPLNDTTGNTHPNLENANPGHSPYLQFAREIRQSQGYPIGLIQTALGGSALSQWNPIENPDAPLFRNLLHCCALAGGSIKGMLWYQGESDCGGGLADTYGTRFADFVGAVRDSLGQPDLPVILAQLNRHTGEQDATGHRGWSIVREAQRRAAEIEGVAVVSSLDLPISDGIHTSSPGNVILGSRKARAAQGMVYGRDVAWRSAEAVSARVIEGGRDVEVEFDYVTNRLEFLGPGEADFVVEGDLGDAPVASAVSNGGNIVRISTARQLKGQVKIHGAFGACPSSNLRDPETNDPIL